LADSTSRPVSLSRLRNRDTWDGICRLRQTGPRNYALEFEPWERGAGSGKDYKVVADSGSLRTCNPMSTKIRRKEAATQTALFALQRPQEVDEFLPAT